MSVLRGVRPVALKAVSERERLIACPHRAQSAVNHMRALGIAAAAAPVEPPAAVEETPKARKRGRK